MRIFISYASEDVDLAAPIAEKLTENHEVWFAPYELTVGDSLFQKINQGLQSCDYGVVILSHQFFAKQWPQAELNGLFALEVTYGKMILPVWRDLTAEDIREYSPILADRLAANWSRGVDAVVAELRLAIGASDRQKTLGKTNPGVEKLRTLAAQIDERQQSELLLSSEVGVRLVSDATGHFFDIVEKTLAEIPNRAALNARCERTRNEMLQVMCNYRLVLSMALHKAYVNTASMTELRAYVFRGKEGHFMENKEVVQLSKQVFKPFVQDGPRVVWKPEGEDRNLSVDELLSDVLERFRTEFAKVALSN